MSAVGKIINGVFVPFGEENRQQFTGTPEEINQNIESGQLQNGATVFDNGTNKSIGKIENGAYVPYTGGDTTVDFTEAETRENIEPINSVKNIFGKIKKWFTDIGDAAFANIVNNRTTTEPGFVMDARQGKEIQDQIDTLNSALDNIGGSGSTIVSLVQKTGNFNLIADNHQSLETYTVPENGFYYVGFNINGYVNVDCRICSSINAAGVIVGSDDKTLIEYFAGTMSAIVKLNQGDKIIATVYSSATYSGSTRIYFFNVIKL